MKIRPNLLGRLWKRKSRDELKDRIVATDATAGYRPPRLLAHELLVEELPIFNLFTARLMLRDPVVRIGLTLRNAALHPGEFSVEDCPSEAVAKYVYRALTTLWRESGTKLRRTKQFGFQGLQINYRHDQADKFIYPESVSDFSPADTRVLLARSKPIGFTVRGSQRGGINYDISRAIEGKKLFAPSAAWLTYEDKWNSHYGEAILVHSYPSWYEKWMNNGSKKVTQLRMIKDAYHGDVLYYPPTGVIQLPDGTKVSVRDLAREAMENKLSGGTLALPMLVDANGNPNIKYEHAQDTGNPEGIFRWGEENDRHILLGLSVSEEIIRASETGSGYSGRSVPLSMMLASCDEEFMQILQCLDEYVVRPCVWLNFGKDVDYSIVPKPLLETFAQDMGGTPMGGGPMGGQPGQPGGPPNQGPNGSPGPQQPVQMAEKNAPVKMPSVKGMPSASISQIANTGIFAANQWKLGIIEEIENESPSALKMALAVGGAAAAVGIFAEVFRRGRRAIQSYVHDVLWGASVVGSADIADRVRSLSAVSPRVTVPQDTPGEAGLLPRFPAPSAPPVFVPPPSPAPETILEPPSPELPAATTDPPRLRFPVVDKALKTISNSPAAAGSDYLETASLVRNGAFAITTDLEESAIAEIRDLVQKHIDEGPDLVKFKKEVRQLFTSGKGSLSDSHIELVFRANVFSYMSNAAHAALQDQRSSDLFPYRLYQYTDDDRVRESHKLLGTSGLSGTAVYRADDPIWQEFRPPWDYNCRCNWAPMTVKQAARAGVEEAKAWLDRARKMARVEGGRDVLYLNATKPTDPEHVQRPSDGKEELRVSAAWTRQFGQKHFWDDAASGKENRQQGHLWGNDDETKHPRAKAGSTDEKYKGGRFVPKQHIDKVEEEVEEQQEKKPKRKASLEDFGEEIEGARKHRAKSTGPRAKKPKDSRPAWARRYEISRIEKSTRPAEEGKWAIYDTKKKGWHGMPRQASTTLFESKEEAEKALPLLEVARNHRVGKDRGKEEYSIYRNLGNRKYPTVMGGFSSIKEAQQYMAEHPEAIINHKFEGYEKLQYLDKSTLR